MPFLTSIRHEVKSLLFETFWPVSDPMPNIFGRVALITGGLGGIGLSYAKHLMSNEIMGIVLADINEENVEATVKRLEGYGKGDVTFVKVDVNVIEQLRHAFEFAYKKFGQLDIFINNAAVLDESYWKRMIQTNLVSGVTANYLAMKEYLPKYRTKEDSVIVNTLCITSLEPMKSFAVYSSTKAGLMGLHKSLSNKHYYSVHGSRFLAICPGLLRTSMLKTMGTKGVDLDLFDEECCEIPLDDKTDQCGKCLIEALKQGENGSIWICEENRIYEWKIPDRLEVRRSMKEGEKRKPCT